MRRIPILRDCPHNWYFMPDYNKLLQASLPESLDAAIDSINFEYDDAESLLEADVSDFEQLNYCVFAYFTRNDIFYLNRSGRRLLDIYHSPFETSRTVSKPRFRLSEDPSLKSDDRDVVEACRPKHHVKELISLSWGATWLRGSKFPIRSRNGVPLAVLFAGREMLGSDQIQNAIGQQSPYQPTFAEN